MGAFACCAKAIGFVDYDDVMAGHTSRVVSYNCQGTMEAPEHGRACKPCYVLVPYDESRIESDEAPSSVHLPTSN